MTLTTSPLGGQPRINVRNVAVDVVDGPEKGRRAEADSELLTVGTAATNALVLTDSTVSKFHLELAGGELGVEVRDLGSTNGTFAKGIRVMRGVVQPGTELEIGRTRLLVREGSGVVLEVHEGDELGGLRGKTPTMRRLMAQVGRVARTSVAVLLMGESGTGKELVARAIHEQSQRRDGPFVTVDCGALSPTLVASELFGHERGAFTGAERQHAGAFERADGGTLFLDEIGELPAELQPQLLGALERRRFRRLGGRSEVKVDVRVVSATNRDLRAEVNAGSFRTDLYYRLAVVVLGLPPLRERSEDIPLLVAHFLCESGHGSDDALLRPGGAFAPERLRALADHHWPGNVRELRNWVEATLALGEAPELLDGVAPPARTDEIEAAVLELSYRDARERVLHDFERAYLEHLLAAAAGNVSHAARRAEMDRSYLLKLLQRHRLR